LVAKAGLLCFTSSRILSTYSRRVLFFAGIGLLFAVFSDVANFGIAGYPLRSVLLLAANGLISWTLAGLMVALWIKPRSAVAAPAQT